MDQRIMRVWFSDDGNYKIVWNRQCMGVQVKPHFHALVREYAGGENKVWSFAGRRGPYRKLNTAIAACAYHEKVWRAMIQIAQGEFKGRAERIRSLDGRARVGTAPFRGRVFSGLPVWVRHEAADAYRIINGTIFGKQSCKTDDDNDPYDQPGALTTSESSSPTTPESESGQETTLTTHAGGPASSAPVEGEFETPPTETPSKDTSSRRGTSAKRAKAKAAPTKKPSKRSTTKKSESTKSPSPTGKKPPKSGAKPSRSSRAKKGEPSKGSASQSSNDGE